MTTNILWNLYASSRDLTAALNRIALFEAGAAMSIYHLLSEDEKTILRREAQEA